MEKHEKRGNTHWRTKASRVRLVTKPCRAAYAAVRLCSFPICHTRGTEGPWGIEVPICKNRGLHSDTGQVDHNLHACQSFRNRKHDHMKRDALIEAPTSSALTAARSFPEFPLVIIRK